MTPTIFYNLVMGLIGAFQYFLPAYVLTQGGPLYATYFYGYMLWRLLSTLRQWYGRRHGLGLAGGDFSAHLAGLPQRIVLVYYETEVR